MVILPISSRLVKFYWSLVLHANPAKHFHWSFFQFCLPYSVLRYHEFLLFVHYFLTRSFSTVFERWHYSLGCNSSIFCHVCWSSNLLRKTLHRFHFGNFCSVVDDVRFFSFTKYENNDMFYYTSLMIIKRKTYFHLRFNKNDEWFVEYLRYRNGSLSCCCGSCGCSARFLGCNSEFYTIQIRLYLFTIVDGQ